MNQTPYIIDSSVPQSREFFTPRQLAEWLGVSLRTVANLQTRHIIPFVKLGRLVRFRRSAVEAALKAHTVEGIYSRSIERRDKP